MVSLHRSRILGRKFLTRRRSSLLKAHKSKVVPIPVEPAVRPTTKLRKRTRMPSPLPSPTPSLSLPYSTHSSTEEENGYQSPCPPSRSSNKKRKLGDRLRSSIRSNGHSIVPNTTPTRNYRLRFVEKPANRSSPAVVVTTKPHHLSSPRHRSSSLAVCPSHKGPRQSQSERRDSSPMVVPLLKHGWLEDQVRRTMHKKLRRMSHRGWQTDH